MITLGIACASGSLSSGSEGLSFSSSMYPSSVTSCSSQLLARWLDRIDFPLSKRSSKEIRFFHLVLAVLLKCFSNGVQPIERSLGGSQVPDIFFDRGVKRRFR